MAALPVTAGGAGAAAAASGAAAAGAAAGWSSAYTTFADNDSTKAKAKIA